MNSTNQQSPRVGKIGHEAAGKNATPTSSLKQNRNQNILQSIKGFINNFNTIMQEHEYGISTFDVHASIQLLVMINSQKR